MKTIGLLFLGSLLCHAVLAQTLTLEPQTIPVMQRLHATIEATQQSTVTAQTAGTVLELHYDVNDYVAAGDLIIVLDDTSHKAAVKQAQAQLKQAQAQLKQASSQWTRFQTLYKQKSVSRADYDAAATQHEQALAQLQQAKALLQQAEQQLSYTRIHAPYAGIVKQRHVELGESVQPGQPLMTGLSLQQLRIVTQLPQRLVPLIQQQAPIHAYTEQGDMLPIQQCTLFPYANPHSHSSTLRCDLTMDTMPTPLYPGMWVTLQVESAQRQGLLIPESAIIRRSELTAVKIESNTSIQLRQVKLGQRVGTDWEVLGGLHAGERIIRDANAK